jgi:NADPH-dependent ferric siderophore reductase
LASSELTRPIARTGQIRLLSMWTGRGNRRGVSCDSERMPRGFAHLAATVPSRPAGDLDDEQLLAKAHGSARWNLSVVAVDHLTPRMLRVTMSAAGLDAMEWQPAQDLTVLITRAGGRDIRRRYTIAAQAADWVQLDVYLHGEGIGTAWVRALQPGDTVSAIGPRGKLLLNQDADWHVLIGDETSLPGIRAMLASTDRPAHVVVQVDDPAQWRRLDPGARPATRWKWVARGPSGHAGEDLALPAGGFGHAYVSGEAGWVLAWHNQLERLGFDESAISHKAYWGAGRANATHGEPLV